MAKGNDKDRQRQAILRVAYALLPTPQKLLAKSKSTAGVQIAAVFSLLENPLPGISNLGIRGLSASLNNIL